MTKQQLQDKASRLFGKKPWKHKRGVLSDYCDKCDEKFRQRFIGQGPAMEYYLDGPCPIPDPIDINNMGLAIEAFRTLDYIRLKREMMVEFAPCPKHYDWLDVHAVFMEFIVKKATPAQIFEIAVLAAEGK